MISHIISPEILGFILVGIVFLIIQGVSELLKSYWAAKKGKWPGDKDVS